VATTVELSRREARRVAIVAQGLADPQPRGRVDRRHFRRVIDRVALVQLDSVNVLARSHELVFFARLGPYDREALTRWLWASREVFEYWGHEASLHPVERHPLLRWRMAGEHAWGGVRSAARDSPEMVAAALAQIAEQGPVTMGELEVHRTAPRREQSWWGWGTGKRVVEHLFWAGEVTAVRRNGFSRAYMLPERWLPAEVLAEPTPPRPEAQRRLVLLAARAHGVATARDLGDYYRMSMADTTEAVASLVADGALLPARVEGWRQDAYLHPEARVPRRRLRARALLSPFDSLIWERQRTQRVWGFTYRLEIYVPAAKRVHGYYVLPFLLDDSLVARVDLKADRPAGLLRVRAAWSEDLAGDRDAPDPDRVATELAGSLAEMAIWLGLDGVVVEPRGDLAAHLARAVDATGPADETMGAHGPH
jgi:uncharacterized protein